MNLDVTGSSLTLILRHRFDVLVIRMFRKYPALLWSSRKSPRHFEENSGTFGDEMKVGEILLIQ